MSKVTHESAHLDEFVGHTDMVQDSYSSMVTVKC
jgi:hypothetical protein